LVECEWVDASTSGGPGWVGLDEAREFAASPPPVMRTVGFLLHEQQGSSGYLVLTDTLGYNECAAVHKIPNAMILDWRIL